MEQQNLLSFFVRGVSLSKRIKAAGNLKKKGIELAELGNQFCLAQVKNTLLIFHTAI